MELLSLEQIYDLVQTIPDFPKKGINFKDITPILENNQAFSSLITHMAEKIHPETTKLVAIESRGFIFASALALKLDLGFILARKPGKLPQEVLSQSFKLEYGEDRLEIHLSSLNSDDQVSIIDDVIATGGTAHAAELLCKKLGATVLGSHFIIELEALNGRQRLSSLSHSIYQV